MALLAGSWLSGYFIIATNAFMQHPVGYAIAPGGTYQVARLAEFVFNPWAIVEYLHNQAGATVTGAFVMAAIGAFWMLRGEHLSAARVSLKTGVIAGFIAANLVAFPTGHTQGRMVAAHQPVTLAAHGRTLRERHACAAGDDRAAERGRAQARQPDRVAVAAVVDRLRRLFGERPRAHGISGVRLARRTSSSCTTAST